MLQKIRNKNWRVGKGNENQDLAKIALKLTKKVFKHLIKIPQKSHQPSSNLTKL